MDHPALVFIGSVWGSMDSGFRRKDEICEHIRVSVLIRCGSGRNICCALVTLLLGQLDSRRKCCVNRWATNTVRHLGCICCC